MASDMDRKRILVLGLDAATLDLIEPWVGEGCLPHFRWLMEEGVWGQLESTIPPSSAAAWSSFATGKNPGKHGIFTFVLRNPDGYSIRSVSGGYRKATPFWKILDQQGLRVGVINMPMTYPPDRLENGFMVSGFDAPGVESDFVYPPQLKEVLKRNHYLIDPTEKNREAWAQSLVDAFRIQKRTFWELKATQHWDVLVMVFLQLDRAQHLFWHEMETNDPQFGKVIFELYQEADTLLGEVLHDLDDDTILIVLSDHGAGPVYKGVSINQWLLHEGYLAFREPGRARKTLSKTLFQAFKLEKIYLPSAIRGYLRKRFARIRDRSKSYLLTEGIDWSKTRVFSIGTYEGTFINLRGRESQGVVSPEDYATLRDKIAQKLLSLRDPETGQPAIRAVYRREELYNGPYVDQAPDLIVYWGDGYKRDERVGEKHPGVFQRKPKLIPSLNYVINGSHRLHGVLFLYGASFKQGSVEGAKIMDLTPTMLYLLGVPVPDDMDGRVLTEALDPQWLTRHPIAHATPSAPGDGDEEFEYSDEDQTLVEEHLRALGYLD